MGSTRRITTLAETVGFIDFSSYGMSAADVRSVGAMGAF